MTMMAPGKTQSGDPISLVAILAARATIKNAAPSDDKRVAQGGSAAQQERGAARLSPRRDSAERLDERRRALWPVVGVLLETARDEVAERWRHVGRTLSIGVGRSLSCAARSFCGVRPAKGG